jgi:anti-sigma factor RsiW
MISEHPADIILLDYVEGTLRADESDTVRRHIATCRACRRTLAEISSTVSELERLPTADHARDHEGGTGVRRHLRTAARLAPLLIAVTALLCTLLIIRPDSTGRSGSSGSQRDAAGRGTAAVQSWFGRVGFSNGSLGLSNLVRRRGARLDKQPPGTSEAYIAVASTPAMFNTLKRQLSKRVVRSGTVSLPVVLLLLPEAAPTPEGVTAAAGA